MKTKTKLKFTPFTILIDNREGLPYTFNGLDPKQRIVLTKYAHLKTGDYSLLGCESEIMLERKTLQDLFFTLGQERERFENEFRRMSDATFAAVIVEASIEEILNPTACRSDWQSRLHPNSVVGTITSWSLYFPNVHWFLCGNREQAERMTFDLLRKFWIAKEKQKEVTSFLDAITH